MAVLALIVPLGDLGNVGGGSPGVPTHPIYYPPGVNVPVFPTHPIAPGGSPPGIWGGSGQPMPTPPIHLPPGSPPGIWGGSGQPMPTPPIHLPQPPGGVVSPPIYYPPVIAGGPGWLPPFPAHPIAPGGGGSPPGIWNPAFPTNPIVIPIPPVEPPEGGPEVSQPIGGGHVLVWHPTTGWFIAPVGGLPPVKPTVPDQGLPPTPPTPEPKSKSY